MKITSYSCDAPHVYLPPALKEPLGRRIQRRLARVMRLSSLVLLIVTALLTALVVHLLRSAKARLWTCIFAVMSIEYVLLMGVGIWAGMGRRDKGKGRVRKRVVLGIAGVALFMWFRPG